MCIIRCMLHAFKSILILCRMGQSWHNTEIAVCQEIEKGRGYSYLFICMLKCILGICIVYLHSYCVLHDQNTVYLLVRIIALCQKNVKGPLPGMHTDVVPPLAVFLPPDSLTRDESSVNLEQIN